MGIWNFLERPLIVGHSLVSGDFIHVGTYLGTCGEIFGRGVRYVVVPGRVEDQAMQVCLVVVVI